MGDDSIQQFQADIQDLCVGEIPVLVGSCLCHQPVQRATCAGAPVSYFIVTFYHMTFLTFYCIIGIQWIPLKNFVISKK